MQSFKKYITEVFDQVYPIKWTSKGKGSDGEWNAVFETDAGETYDIHFIRRIILDSDEKFTELVFQQRGKGYGITRSGDALAVFSTVIDAVDEYIERYGPNLILWSAEEHSRRKLYRKMTHSLPKKYPTIRRHYRVYEATSYISYYTFLLANDADEELLTDAAREVGFPNPNKIKEVH